jgi:hypothetical protein
MKLSHLLLMIFFLSVLMPLFALIEGIVGIRASFGVREWIAAIPAFFVALVCAWPISRVLRMPPLMFLAGPCPKCQQRPAGWWATQPERDELVLRCGACGEQLVLWLGWSSSANLTSFGCPMFVLRRPKFLGMWRRIDLA